MSIELQHLKKTYENGEEVLTDINTTIADGQFYILVGASGSGKSTILNAIAGFIPIDEGTITINGKDVTRLPPKDRNLSMVFQNYALMPNLTVSENIVFGLTARHTAKALRQKKLQEVLDLVHLEAYKNKKPGNLSGGQRQRVSLARALVSDAKIILMDEPLSNLDAKLRAEMRKEIRLLQQQLGITVIYVTHDQTEAMTMGDQVMLLNKGKIEQIGSPLELYNVPANTFVADFFGSPAINLIDVSIENNILKMKNGVAVPFNWEHINGTFKLGVRPENIVMTRSGKMSGTIVHIEPLGDGTNLEINFGLDATFRVKVNEQIHLVVGDAVNFDILLDKVLLFTQDGQLIKVGQSELVAVSGQLA
ncbi:ABC transporter ATP-binding protein [uncultured Leuconostoc sp.]|uniref:ABC transporter ATP-binding protein n=1 Tax=uncultured Leuconostoc sp. TaxID=173262 RepID=UPI0025EF31EE|nr:ABC transporter ATP-binding protein [uncultured Leuconostoc sp.]